MAEQFEFWSSWLIDCWLKRQKFKSHIFVPTYTYRQSTYVSFSKKCQRSKNKLVSFLYTIQIGFWLKVYHPPYLPSPVKYCGIKKGMALFLGFYVAPSIPIIWQQVWKLAKLSPLLLPFLLHDSHKVLCLDICIGNIIRL